MKARSHFHYAADEMFCYRAVHNGHSQKPNTETNQNYIQEEINTKLNLGRACYRRIQNLSSSRLQSKSLKIKIHKMYRFTRRFVRVKHDHSHRLRESEKMMLAPMTQE
jgi:hypothetical protein